ncbi:unnamed protein product [Bursaphelenchus xylophilus]|uniref:(pine wood nematode) hypothetical protein n=1 Tax=Bursaphelenchus xylophilus TaxID=6326 RepID=A0A1I7RTR6_BURXY|nr:unnamed protein product [Bursaphelenchus xylophilus]CAG9122189.1 unnamed protein product [Bursaphelenchus xylophilus]
MVYILLFILFLVSVDAHLYGDYKEDSRHVRANIPLELVLEESCSLSIKYKSCRCGDQVDKTVCCCMDRHIQRVPKHLHWRMKTLFIYNTSISHIEHHSFHSYKFLEKLQILQNDKLEHVDKRAFEGLEKLFKLEISGSPFLRSLPEVIVPHAHRLQLLILRNNGLPEIPNFRIHRTGKFALERIDLSYNRIQSIKVGALDSLVTKVLLLNNNEIQEIEEYAFPGCEFGSLNISNNKELSTISPSAFSNIVHIEELDLSGSQITELPYDGLKEIKKLRLQRIPTLKRLPPILAFTNLHKADFTYPYHCCFLKYATKEYSKGNDQKFSSNYRQIQRRTCTKLRAKEEQAIRFRRAIASWSKSENLNAWFEKQARGLDINKFVDEPVQTEVQAYRKVFTEKSFVVQRCEEEAVANFYLNITCTPLPDALNPCEDIVSYPTLRIFLWPMWIIAIVGNISVWFIIAAVWHRRLRFHYFFMLNLSVADFLTGVYLAFLAFADFKTANQYYNHAVEWQTGWGCNVVGFISVFASELSIVSMLMIAFEIYYNARYAFYGKWMSSTTAYITIFLGYLYAFVMAALPLFGISSYEVSSICLPLSIDNVIDQIYLVGGLTTTALAFAGIILNYALINFMIRGDPTMPARAEDRQILIRTLVLIGTDMLCWLPTLFFGITAALGVPLITLTNAKICLILFYPINSCANPLIYVYMTKIWTDVKNKAPFFEVRSFKTEKSQVNRFYYNNSPRPEKNRSTSLHNDDAFHSRENQTTQTTSLNSTPRGSNSSTLFRHSAAEIEPLRRSEDRRDQTPETDCPRLERKRKSIPAIPTFRFRVSAIPEMSDISESSSNSQEENERRSSRKSQERKVSRLALEENCVNGKAENSESENSKAKKLERYDSLSI